MRKLFLAVLGIAVGLAAVNASAQSPVPVRGTITALNGNVLSIKTREGTDMRIELAQNATIAYTKAVKLSDIKAGTGVGVAAVEGADGKLVARYVSVFPPERGIPNEGQRPMTEPKSTMTNATVSLISATAQGNQGRELTLTYKGGSATVFVPENAPIITAVDGDRSLLVPGEYVYIAGAMNVGGQWTTSRVQVSKDGVRPPQ